MLARTMPWFVFTVTILTYCYVLFKFVVNVPYYDDITQIIWILNEFIDPKLDSTFVTIADTPDKLHALFYPNAGHIPLGTRLFALLQFYTGGINFRVSIWAANAGWLLTLYLFIRYSVRNTGVPLLLLLPVPFLMLSITHWEAMSMALGAWQMYWGAALFPMLVLIAVVSGAPLLASAMYFGALFESGGSLSLYPLVLAFFLLRKEWKSFLIFAVLGGLQTGVFLHFNSVSANLQAKIPALIDIAKFVLAFVGNIYSEGSYDLQSVAGILIPIGALLIAIGVFCLFKVRGAELPKLLFIYVLILAFMTVYRRPEMWIVSRYSVFALLATCSIYLLFIKYARETFSTKTTGAIAIVSTCLAAGLWASSLYHCSKPLGEDHKSRILALQQFIETGDASGLMWNGPWASEILREAKRIGVYDYEVGRTLTP